MHLPRLVYEALPYVYTAAGLGGLIGSWLVNQPVVAPSLLIVGALSLMLGLVLVLRRWDYRTRQVHYNSRSLEEI